MSHLGVNLRTIRVSRYMTIGDLSMKSQVHHSLISKLERGYIPARCIWLPDLEKALGLAKGHLIKLHKMDVNSDIVLYDMKELRAGRKVRIEQDNKLFHLDARTRLKSRAS